jgi:hypothetical protein
MLRYVPEESETLLLFILSTTAPENERREIWQMFVKPKLL